MNTEHKIIPFDDLANWRRRVLDFETNVVVTNGCFDILHVGHVKYLEQSSQLGDALLVGINDDVGVRELKGSERPLNNQDDRAHVIAALQCVSFVCIFPGKRATKFLKAAKPSVYVKGGDYTIETLDPDERQVLQSGGAKIEIIPFVKDRSTTALLQKIRSL